jgi:signal transduction histidine kinase
VLNRKRDSTATRVATIFLLAGVTVIGVQGYVLGVPAAWIAAAPMLFLLAVSLIYLAFLPRSTPLPNIWRTVLKFLFISAGVLAVMGWIEGLFLLPDTSWYDLTGFSLYSAGMVAVSAAVLILALILLYRWQKSTIVSERRQLSILLLFILLGGVPSILLGFLPRYLTGEIVLPLSIAIALLILCPLGYLYVVFRHDYLRLDPVFSQGAAIFLTLISMLGLYTILYYAVQQIVVVETVWMHLLLITPLIWVAFLMQPISQYLDRVFYGSTVVVGLTRLPEIVSQLSAKPTVSTLQMILRDEAEQFEIPQILLAFANGNGKLTITSRQDADNSSQPSIALAPREFMRRFQSPNHPLFQQHPWAEWLVPIMLHENRIGYIALSCPKGNQFNNLHRQFFARLADMLAIASDAILLFEFAENRSVEVLRAREIERRRLASRIHDSPLQTLTLIKNDLLSVATSIRSFDPSSAEILEAKVDFLADTSDELRAICVGLNPPAIDQGLGFVAEDLALRFGRQYALQVQLNLDLPLNCDESNELAKAVYHIIQESLNNIVKHSGTNEAEISMVVDNSSLRLDIVDHGQGTTLVEEAAPKQKLGLQNMIEWARYAGGQLSIEPNRPNGTRVAFVAPLEGLPA